jgi:hypothetical protein
MTAGPGGPVRKSAAAAAAPEAGNGDDRSDGPGSVATRARHYLRQHPVAATVIAAGVGVLLQTGLAAVTRPGGRSHDTGAAAMEFSSRHPDGKKVSFEFSWKKRPVELSDADWPVDQMGFTASRPDGKQTAFQFTRKTRRVPDGYGVSSAEKCRPGLGEARMDFRFTWNKQPPARPGKLSSADGSGAGHFAPTPAKRPGQKGGKTRDPG